MKNFTMSNDCLCEIIHKRNLYDVWQLCEIIHNLGYRRICLPVPEVGHGSKTKPINSLSGGAVCGARAWLRASEANQKWLLIFLYVIDIKALSSRPEVEPNGLLEVALSSPVACLR